MKTKNKGNRYVLAVIIGILFSGLVLNSIEELEPSKVISIDQASLVEDESETVKIDSSEEMKEVILEESVSTKAEDAVFKRKVENVNTFLKSRNSPLAQYAEEFVKAADHYGIDYRLVASISIIESSGGIHTFRAYNAWGWGKSGFDSWTDGIWSVSKGLGKYYARGLTTPKKIAPVYCPPNAVKWANNVQYIMNQIES